MKDLAPFFSQFHFSLDSSFYIFDSKQNEMK